MHPTCGLVIDFTSSSAASHSDCKKLLVTALKVITSLPTNASPCKEAVWSTATQAAQRHATGQNIGL